MKKLFLFTLALCSSLVMFGQAASWMGNSYIVANDAWYNASGQGNPAFDALGTIESLKIAGQVQSYGDSDGENNPAFMSYRFDDSETWTNVELKWFKYENNNNFFGANDNTAQVAAVGFDELADGDHTIEVYFYKASTDAKADANGKIYDNNDGNNFKATFKKRAVVKEDITYKVAVPEGTTACYIAGDWDANGNWTFKEMTAVNAVDHQFEYLAKDQLASFKYKYCSAASWDNVEVTADNGNVNDRTYTGEIDVVAKWKAADEPQPVTWYLKGDFVDEWATPFNLTGDDQTALSVAVTLEANKYYEFKIVRSEGGNETWFGLPSWEKVTSSVEGWVCYESKGNDNQANVGLQTAMPGEYVITVDVTNKDGENIAPKFSIQYPADNREKREIVFLAGEVAGDNATLIVFGFGNDMVPSNATMTLKEEGVYTAQIAAELDSLIFVRAAAGVEGWNALVWEGENKNVWNQSHDEFITCDTAAFVDWELETPYFTVSWCGQDPVIPIVGDTWFIKLPVAENDWTWHEMLEEENGTWSYDATWVGGGANINTEMVDETATYIADNEMDFGENLVAPEAGTACTFIWNPATQKLAVDYIKADAVENITFELNTNAPMYNVLGVEVDADFKGIVIQNGHKFVR